MSAAGRVPTALGRQPTIVTGLLALASAASWTELVFGSCRM